MYNLCRYRLLARVWLHWQTPPLTWGSIPGTGADKRRDRFAAAVTGFLQGSGVPAPAVGIVRGGQNPSRSPTASAPPIFNC